MTIQETLVSALTGYKAESKRSKPWAPVTRHIKTKKSRQKTNWAVSSEHEDKKKTLLIILEGSLNNWTKKKLQKNPLKRSCESKNQFPTKFFIKQARVKSEHEAKEDEVADNSAEEAEKDEVADNSAEKADEVADNPAGTQKKTKLLIILQECRKRQSC